MFAASELLCWPSIVGVREQAVTLLTPKTVDILAKVGFISPADVHDPKMHLETFVQSIICSMASSVIVETRRLICRSGEMRVGLVAHSHAVALLCGSCMTH